jgi:CheY-like chemotaxis protein
MKRVLLVDDDPVVLKSYKDVLARQGFQVDTASDGLLATKALRTAKPDVVVLDLMMPKLSGVEVLKFMRGTRDLASVPVILLSNAYMIPMVEDAVRLGAQKGLLKMKCNPTSLIEAVNDLLAGRSGRDNPDQLLAASPTAPRTAARVREPITSAPAAVPEQAPAPMAAQTAESRPIESKPPGAQTASSASQDFLNNAPAISRSLRQLFKAFQDAGTQKDRELSLQDYYRKVHFVTAMAGMAEHHRIAQMASAFEALLFGMMDKVSEINPSVLRTMTMAVDFLEQLFERAREGQGRDAPPASVLVVDDDRLSNRLVLSALRNAQVQARGTESPETALRLLQESRFDLILLDIEMPGMDGIELCRRLRGLPGYAKTPVIYVTLHSDFETAVKTAASGGNDLIAKPILPAELAVKTVMHLLKSQLAG